MRSDAGDDNGHLEGHVSAADADSPIRTIVGIAGDDLDEVIDGRTLLVAHISNRLAHDEGIVAAMLKFRGQSRADAFRHSPFNGMLEPLGNFENRDAASATNRRIERDDR